MNSLSQYERKQVEAIARWRAEGPSIATRALGRASSPASRAVENLVPGAVLEGALGLVQNTAERLADRKSILKRAGVQHLSQLSAGTLERSDRASYAVTLRGTLLAGGTGMAYGMIGAAGMILDVPTLLVLSFRTIHRVGLCYGEDLSEDPQLPLALFALSSANTAEEKRTALALVEQVRTSPGLPAFRTGVQRAVQRELAKEAALMSMNNLSRQFAKRLGWRMAGGMIPIIGAGVGGGVNAWYLYEVAEAAKRSFQWRWLQRRSPSLELPQISVDEMPTPVI